MDQSNLLIAGLTVVAAALISFYTVLVIWSPERIIPDESERKYRSKKCPTTPLPLGSIHNKGEVDLTIVIPAYNETTRLPAMFKSTMDHLSTIPNRTYEILIVDDGSSDGTSDLALKLADEYPDSDIRVVTLRQNLGKGGTVRHGMLHGRGRRLLFADADGASRFEDLELLWSALDEIDGGDRAAIAIGSRAHLVKTDAVVKRSLLRNILMYGLHTILRIVGVGHIRDTQCGFKLFTRKAAQQIFPYQHLPTWIFDVELLLIAKQLSIPVAEVPIEWHEVSGSKLNVVTDSLQMLRDLLILRANLLLGRWKVAPMPEK
ncbi:Alg5-prov protein [Panus rudis PR-1116 ss-1]|nr:Alg5-prov protein [Panus rudis PR-1116 ss-1]